LSLDFDPARSITNQLAKANGVFPSIRAMPPD